MLPILAALVAFGGLPGCGPSNAAALQADVEAALAAARDVDAPERAPYEWTLAEAYHRHAKAEAGRADFEDAAVLSQKAIEAADLARQKALSDPAPAPAPALESAEGGRP